MTNQQVTICDLCKLLVNPLRLEILERVCLSKDGINVGYLVDDMSLSGIGQSGISQYLKQLATIGLIRRVRAGKYVNYVRSTPPIALIATAADAIIDRLQKKGDRDFVRAFGVLMNPFRAKVVAAVAKAGAIPAAEICERLEHQVKYLKRDLQEAVDAGLLDPDDSDTALAVYHYVEPADPLVRLLISLIP